MKGVIQVLCLQLYGRSSSSRHVRFGFELSIMPARNSSSSCSCSSSCCSCYMYCSSSRRLDMLCSKQEPRRSLASTSTPTERNSQSAHGKKHLPGCPVFCLIYYVKYSPKRAPKIADRDWLLADRWPNVPMMTILYYFGARPSTSL